MAGGALLVAVWSHLLRKYRWRAGRDAGALGAAGRGIALGGVLPARFAYAALDRSVVLRPPWCMHIQLSAWPCIIAMDLGPRGHRRHWRKARAQRRFDSIGNGRGGGDGRCGYLFGTRSVFMVPAALLCRP